MTERDIFQKEVVELSKLHKFLAVEAATGTGKGKACFMSILEDNSEKKWLILVPEILQIENLKKDIEKHNLLDIYNKIEDIICYASFDKYKGKSLNIWANEVHRLSELKSDISKTINFDKIIVDSATIPYDVKERLNSIGGFYYHKVSLQEAIDKKILPTPVIYKISTILDNESKRNIKKYGKNTSFLTDKKYAESLDKDLEYWKKRYAENPSDKWIGNMLNKIGGNRKKFFSDKKTENCQNLIRYLNNKRFICFTGSIEQADILNSNNSVHSKKTKKQNINTLNLFNNKQIDSIFMNKMGREGLNLTDIECVIIIQLGTGNDEGLQFLQSIGRGLRAENPEIYILYCKDTKDEEFVNKALKHVNNNYIQEFNKEKWKNIQ